MSSGLKCSQHLEESRACDAACFFRYEWSLTPWSSCQPIGDSSCGEGKRRRGAKCIRLNDKRTVRETLCNSQDKPFQDLETWCPTDCPVDCEVSAWTAWDQSLCSCHHPMNMTRRRVMTTQASPSGRPCPAALEESKPCPAYPCYKAKVSSPVVCDLQGAACGVGVVSHNVTCLRDGGGDFIPEDFRRCKDDELFGRLQSDDSCFKPCPSDCLLSDWSSWSECQGLCVGSRTRNTLHIT